MIANWVHWVHDLDSIITKAGSKQRQIKWKSKTKIHVVGQKCMQFFVDFVNLFGPYLF